MEEIIMDTKKLLNEMSKEELVNILDDMITDRDIKILMARRKYCLNILINDEDWAVRAEVAKQGYGLDKLIKDKDYRVRNRVAMQGYGLDKLANDKDYRVRETVKFMLTNNINKLA